MVFDIRPIYSAHSYAAAHNELYNLTVPDAHPISAITGFLTTEPNTTINVTSSSNMSVSYIKNIFGNFFFNFL